MCRMQLPNPLEGEDTPALRILKNTVKDAAYQRLSGGNRVTGRLAPR